IWQRTFCQSYPYGRKLFHKAGFVVVNTIFCTECFDLWSNLNITVGRHIREQMMLNLMAQITTQYMQPLGTAKIARTTNLTDIPFCTGFLIGIVHFKGFGIFSEMSVKNNSRSPQATDHIGNGITGKYWNGIWASNQREKYIIF